MSLNFRSVYIVTPCYNAAATLSQTLESIVAQRGVTLRYHVQDGGSTDGSQDILAAFSSRLASEPENYGHVTFTWGSEKDTGMYDAIARAFSKLDIPDKNLMGWVNADDMLVDGALSLLCDVATALPQYNWFGGVPKVVDTQGNVLATGRTNYFYPQRFLAAGICDGLHWRTLQQEGIFWRKCLWDAAGGIDTRFHLAGDWDLWRRMAQHGMYLQLPQTLAIFRKRAGQLSEGDAYEREVSASIPRTVRRSSLRQLIPDLWNKQVYDPVQRDGSWAVVPQKGALSWKDWLAILPVAMGAYRSFRFLCAINNLFKKQPW